MVRGWQEAGREDSQDFVFDRTVGAAAPDSSVAPVQAARTPKLVL